MIYELRFYSVAPGRMADVHERFAIHLPVLFERHGVDCVGRWSALAGPDAPRFVYLMAYRDYAHREAVWGAFYQDADWWRIRAATNAGHEMVERHDLLFLKPHAAWPAPDRADDGISGLFELVQHQVAPGRNAEAGAFLRETYLPMLEAAGARLVGLFDMAAGSGMQKILMLLAWPDAARWHAGRRQVDEHPALREALAAQRRDAGTTWLLRSEVNLLEAAPGVQISAGLGRA